jgi:hypothetical protein
METLEGFPYLPAFRLRQAKPGFAIATSGFGAVPAAQVRWAVRRSAEPPVAWLRAVESRRAEQGCFRMTEDRTGLAEEPRAAGSCDRGICLGRWMAAGLGPRPARAAGRVGVLSPLAAGMAGRAALGCCPPIRWGPGQQPRESRWRPSWRACPCGRAPASRRRQVGPEAVFCARPSGRAGHRPPDVPGRARRVPGAAPKPG